MKHTKKLAFLIGLISTLQLNSNIQTATNNEMEWKTQKALPIEETYSNWEFRVGDFNRDGKEDLFCIKKDSGNHTNLHILNGADNYKSFLKQIILPIENTDSNWDFKVADCDGDGISDLYCLKKNAQDHTNLHILSGASAFQNFSLQVALPIENTDENWEFGLGDYNGDKKPDLYCIKKNCGTSTNIHILGDYKYQSFLLQIPTILHATGENTEFAVGKGALNIYCFKKHGTSSKKTELHKFGYKDVDPLEVKRQAIGNEAKRHLGKSYVYGAKGPDYFDCSGLTNYVYKQVLNIDIGPSTYQQINAGIEVSRNELLPGDLIFPHSGHVCIYIGNNQMIHAPQTGDVVKISPIYGFWRARRIIH